MDAAILHESSTSRSAGLAMAERAERVISPAEFQRLLVSHRRMVRLDRRADRMRGLQDVETGEVFLIEERRLLEGRR
jgi:hypothetical protein